MTVLVIRLASKYYADICMACKIFKLIAISLHKGMVLVCIMQDP